MEKKNDFVKCPKCYWPSSKSATHCEVCGCPLGSKALVKNGPDRTRNRNSDSDGVVLVRSREKLEDPRREDHDNPWRQVEPLRVVSNSKAMETVSVPEKSENPKKPAENRPKLAAVEMPPQEEDTSEKLQSLLRDIFDETGSKEENQPKKAQDFRNESAEIVIEELFGENEELIPLDDIQEESSSVIEFRMPDSEKSDPPWSRGHGRKKKKVVSGPIQQELPLASSKAPEPPRISIPTERVKIITASPTDRIMAGLFDLALTLTLFVIMGWVGLGFFAGMFFDIQLGDNPFSTLASFGADPSLLISLAFLYLTVVFVYLVFFTATCGESPGQTVFGIRTVMKNSEPVGLKISIKRTFALLFGLAAVGYSLIGLYKYKQGQSPHDRWAGTMVMRRELAPGEHRRIEELA